MSNPFNYYPSFPRVTQPTPQQGQGQGQGFAAPSGSMISPQGQITSAPSSMFEQSYVENILRHNRGKVATVYMTFTGHQQQVFVGYVMGAGRDHIVLRDVNSNKTYILLTIYLDYVTFDEEIALPYQL
ncbi:spore coat protein GerQ [Bacillus sp. EAC]|uniref:spore coat protein GerQ n=1 Tax=Bacillus sp. EAC TaxID=1978338 RepID=UPI00358DEE1A